MRRPIRSKELYSVGLCGESLIIGMDGDGSVEFGAGSLE